MKSKLMAYLLCTAMIITNLSQDITVLAGEQNTANTVIENIDSEETSYEEESEQALAERDASGETEEKSISEESVSTEISDKDTEGGRYV